MNLIFIDIDGTLFNNKQNSIPESAKVVIKKAQQQGDLVIINTGRCKAQVYDNIRQIGFDGYICSDGIYIEYKNEVLKDEPIPLEQLNSVFDFFESQNLGYMAEAVDEVLVSKKYNEQMKQIVGEEVFNHYQIEFPNQIEVEKITSERVGKINFILPADSDTSKKIYNSICEKFSDKLNVCKWNFFDEKTQVVSIAKKNADKVNGIKFLLNQLKLSDVKTYSFGDADADIKMTEFCDVGIAMGNGSENLKKIADFVTASVDKDGIAVAFEKLILK